MKTKLTLSVLALVAVSLNVHAAESAPPAPLPEFMDQQELVKWNTDQAAVQTTAAAAGVVATPFFTGRPYIEGAGGYVFKYRTYNPETSSWTSEDPMGFPDGTNSYRYYPNPISNFDYAGCFAYTLGELGIIGMEAGEAGIATSLVQLNAAVAAVILDPPVGGAIASSAAALVGTATGAMQLGLDGINTGFGDTTTFISQGFGANVNSSVNGIANSLAFDVGVAQGYINPIISLGDEAAAEGHTSIANGYYAAANILDAAFVDPEQGMENTLNGERSLIPTTDGSGNPGYE